MPPIVKSHQFRPLTLTALWVIVRKRRNVVVGTVLAAWIAEQAPQCGYCQSGQIMSAAALLASNPYPTNAQIDDAMGRQSGRLIQSDGRPLTLIYAGNCKQARPSSSAAKRVPSTRARILLNAVSRAVDVSSANGEKPQSSVVPRYGPSYFAQVAEQIELVRMRNHVQRWHVVGHDGGCAIAVQYAHLFPKRVGCMALLSPAIFPDLQPFFLLDIMRKRVIGEIAAPLIHAIFWRIAMARGGGSITRYSPLF